MVSPTPASKRRDRLLLLGGLWAFVLVVGVVFREAVLPFAGAALIAYIVAPLVQRITRLPLGARRIPHWAAILLIYALFFLGVYLFLTALLPQLYREFLRISSIVVGTVNDLSSGKLQTIAEKAERWFNDHGLPVALSSRALEGSAGEDAGHWSLSLDLEQVLRNSAEHASAYVRENFGNLVTVSRNLIVGVIGSVFALFFLLMVAAFFSIDSKKIGAYAGTLIPPERRADAALLLARIDRSLGGVVRGQLTICVINGLLTFIGLLVFGVKFAFILATVATVCSLVPIFGTILSSVPIVLIAVAQSWKSGLGMLAWILGIHALEAYFLNPKIMGQAARIHPVVVAFALVAGERTFGLLGGLFSVPLIAIVVACFDFVREKAQDPGPIAP